MRKGLSKFLTSLFLIPLLSGIGFSQGGMGGGMTPPTYLPGEGIKFRGARINVDTNYFGSNYVSKFGDTNMVGDYKIRGNLFVSDTINVSNLYVTNIWVTETYTNVTISGSVHVHSNLEVLGVISGPTIDGLNAGIYAVQTNLNIASNALHFVDTNLQDQIIIETNRAFNVETNLQNNLDVFKIEVQGSTNNMIENFIMSMTNYIDDVGSSSNYLTYNPITRLLTGCVTNQGTLGIDGTNWSKYIALQNVDFGTNGIILGGELRTNWPTGGSVDTNWIIEQLAIETNRAYNAETNLQSNINIASNALYSVDTNLQAQIIFETNRAINAETNLQNNLNIASNALHSIDINLQDQIVIETNRAYNAETNLQGNIDISSNSLHSVDTNLQSQITAETNRAYIAETNLEAKINSGTNAVYTNLLSLINSETNRAYNSETNIQNNLDLYKTEVGNSTNDIIQKINNETNRAYTVETNLQAQILSETNRAYSAETNLQANINIETNRAYNAETNIQNNLDLYKNVVTGSTNDMILQFIRSMTNYIDDVGSSSNYLTYNPTTRLLTGCVTNQGTLGIDGTNWSKYVALQNVDFGIFDATNVGNIRATSTITVGTNSDSLTNDLYALVLSPNDDKKGNLKFTTWPGQNALEFYQAASPATLRLAVSYDGVINWGDATGQINGGNGKRLNIGGYGGTSIYGVDIATCYSVTKTSGSLYGLCTYVNFIPTSGTATYTGILISDRINQVNSSGTIYGIVIDPVITAVTNYVGMDVRRGNVIVSNSVLANAFIGDGSNLTGITAAQVGAVATNDDTYLSVLRSMTNYVEVVSSSNYLVYDPAIRLLSGCVTNQGTLGVDGTNWSKYVALQIVDMGNYSITNIGTNSLIFSDGVMINSSSVTQWNNLTNIIINTTNNIAVTNLQAQLAAETNRAYNAETNLQSNIDAANQSLSDFMGDINPRTSVWNQAATDVSSATNDIVVLKESTNTLNTAITNNQYLQGLTNAYFETAKTNLQEQIIAETNRSYSVETNLQDQIITETNRAYNAETNLQNNLNIASNSLYSVNTNLQAQIIAETNRAIQAEVILSNSYVAADTVLRSELTNTITVASNALSGRIDGVTNGAALGETAVQDGDTLTTGLYDNGTGVEGNQLARVDWVRGLLQIGNPVYMSSNSIAVGYEPFTAQQGQFDVDINAFSSNGKIIDDDTTKFVHSMISTNTFFGTLMGPASVELKCARQGAGAGQSLSVGMYLYYTYDRTNLTLLNSATGQVVNTAMTTLKYTITFPNTDVTNAYLVYRIKPTINNNTTNIIVYGGDVQASFAELRTPSVETLGIRGATNTVYPGGGTGTYNTVTRIATLPTITAAQVGASSTNDFGNISNRVVIIETNVFSTLPGSNVYFRVDGTTNYIDFSVKENINLNNKTISNGVARLNELAVIDGTPTNTAIFACTNTTTGQGGWIVYPKVYATMTNIFTLIDGVAKDLLFQNLVAKQGGTWDGTTWTPGIIGWTKIQVQVWPTLNSVATVGQGVLYKNGIAYMYGKKQDSSLANRLILNDIWEFYNNNSTSSYVVNYTVSNGSITNERSIPCCYYYGEITP